MGVCWGCSRGCSNVLLFTQRFLNNLKITQKYWKENEGQQCLSKVQTSCLKDHLRVAMILNGVLNNQETMRSAGNVLAANFLLSFLTIMITYMMFLLFQQQQSNDFVVIVKANIPQYYTQKQCNGHPFFPALLVFCTYIQEHCGSYSLFNFGI